MLSTVPAERTWYVRSQARGRSIPSNICTIEEYEWDYGQVQSSALPRHQPSLDISQPLPNEYPDQNESNLNYTTAQPGTSDPVEDITQGLDQPLWVQAPAPLSNLRLEPLGQPHLCQPHLPQPHLAQSEPTISRLKLLVRRS